MIELNILEAMLKEAGYPYYFVDEKYFDHDKVDRRATSIEVGRLAGFKEPQLRFLINNETRKLNVIDMRRAQKKDPDAAAAKGDKKNNLAAQECMAIVERYFEAM